VADQLLSVGLDVGTTTTQVVFSRLTVTNQANAFSVPRLAITRREILYKSPIHFTPLVRDTLIDGSALAALIRMEYRNAGITPEQVDTGAVIITGESSRKENAREVLTHISELAGSFVVTTAGPDLESVLAAKGAGAVALSERTTKKVLHMDIGGGTSNLALLHRGKILRTGCLNVGGRLVRLDAEGCLLYTSPVVKDLFPFCPGQIPGLEALEALARKLTRALETAAGLVSDDMLLRELMTREARPWLPPREPVILSFSGGVADCISGEESPYRYGDLGPVLGRAIRESRLWEQEHRLGRETIRATVIGAGSHSTQLSGSTVFRQNVPLPLKNIPVVPFSGDSALPHRDTLPEGDAVAFFLEGIPGGSYRELSLLADRLAQSPPDPLILCLGQDQAKALGQALAARLGKDARILCLDGIAFPESSYLDVGEPMGPALPVVVKTLVFER